MADETKTESLEDRRVRMLANVDLHLAKTKEGTAMHAILSTLHEFLQEPPAKEYPGPDASVDAAVVNENSAGLNG